MASVAFQRLRKCRKEMRQVLDPPPAGVAPDKLDLQVLEILIEDGFAFFGERRMAVILFLPSHRSICAVTRAAQRYGEGPPEGLHCTDLITSKARRKVRQAFHLWPGGDEVMGHERSTGQPVDSAR